MEDTRELLSEGRCFWPVRAGAVYLYFDSYTVHNTNTVSFTQPLKRTILFCLFILIKFSKNSPPEELQRSRQTRAAELACFELEAMALTICPKSVFSEAEFAYISLGIIFIRAYEDMISWDM